MSKHTPGPWTVAIFRPDGNTERYPTIDEIKKNVCDGIDRTVAHGKSIPDFYYVMSSLDPADLVHVSIVGNGPTSKENAYLVSAAPDLYKACKSIEAWWRLDEANRNIKNIESVIIKALEAIEKAEGK